MVGSQFLLGKGLALPLHLPHGVLSEHGQSSNHAISGPLNMPHLPWKLWCSTNSQHASAFPLSLSYVPFKRPSLMSVSLETSILGLAIVFPATSPLTQPFFPREGPKQDKGVGIHAQIQGQCRERLHRLKGI